MVATVSGWRVDDVGRGLVVLVAASAAYLVVLLSHGVFPGLLPDLSSAYLAEGSIRCLNDLGLSAVTTHCHAFGEPTGYPLLTGGPLLGLGALLMALSGLDAYGAYVLSLAIFDALALLGGYGLMRRLGSSRVVALGAAVAYLIAPTVLGMAPFGGTFVGFALLPAYAWADLYAMDAIRRFRWRPLVVVIAGYALVRCGALFLDGYSFTASLLVGGLLWLQWGMRGGCRTPRTLVGLATFVLANAAAYALYQVYVPIDYPPNPVEIFRSMGLDVATLVVPTAAVWWAEPLGLDLNHQRLWGDGSNAVGNYVGLACLGLAAVYLIGGPRRGEAVAIAAAGAVALVLALGPSLKVDEARPVATNTPTFEDYLMPEDVAAVDFPWAGAFESVPGVESMRASYRWFAVTRMALIVLAGLAITRLVASSGRRRWLAIGLALVALVEIAPNLPREVKAYDRHEDQIGRVRATVGHDLRAATDDGERAFFMTYDGIHNDYMTNMLAAEAGLRVYNAGGDKNEILATSRWPPEVAALAGVAPPADAAVAALESGSVDVILAPYFHPRWSAYSWPPPTETRRAAEDAFAPMLADDRLDVDRYRWFAAIRLAGARGSR